MRHFMLMRFICASCGHRLEVTSSPPREKYDITASYDREPTGADVAGYVCGVEPCRHCLSPLDDMRRAVKTLLGQSGDAADRREG